MCEGGPNRTGMACSRAHAPSLPSQGYPVEAGRTPPVYLHCSQARQPQNKAQPSEPLPQPRDRQPQPAWPWSYPVGHRDSRRSYAAVAVKKACGTAPVPVTACAAPQPCQFTPHQTSALASICRASHLLHCHVRTCRRAVHPLLRCHGTCRRFRRTLRGVACRFRRRSSSRTRAFQRRHQRRRRRRRRRRRTPCPRHGDQRPTARSDL